MTVDFSSTGELLEYLRQEKKKGERFATRFILVQGCQVWDNLISKLNYEVDKAVCLSQFCSSADVFPDMERLKSYLKTNNGGFRSILLTPLAEYIRIDVEATESIGWLAQCSTNKINRLYIPLLSAEGFFRTGINRVPRYHEGLLPNIWSLRGEGNSEVIVAPFHAEDVDKNVIKGVRRYLSTWSRESIRKAWLVTQMAPWLSVQQTGGSCRVRIYMSSFDYVRRTLRLNELCEEWGSHGQWEWLAVQIKQDDNFDELASRILKVVEYDYEQLFLIWRGVTPKEQWLIWLWNKIKIAPKTYLYKVLQKNTNVNCLIKHTTTSVFDDSLPVPLNNCQERKQLLECLGTSYMPLEFWTRYKSLTDPLHKLSVLTDISQQEREEILLCVSELLLTNTDPNNWWDYLEHLFPSLAWYLQPSTTGNSFVDTYFRVYNRCRVKDSSDEQLSILTNRWASEQLLWNYPARNEVISQLRSNGTKIMWVDGMGIEWTGLLSQYLSLGSNVDLTVTVARGNLPTTTEANKEWEEDEIVERGLDDIAHHYSYSHPKSLLKAMEVIEKVANKALALLSQSPSVAITSDHGLSRFVVTEKNKIKATDGLVVEAPGRFATLERNDYHIETGHPLLINKGHVLWLTHGKFQSAGPCRGEVHGGATPEECLTPIIVLHKTGKLKEELPRFEVITKTIKLNPANEGLLIIQSSKVLNTDVELRVAGYQALARLDDSLKLCFSLKNWNPGDYRGKLFYSNRLVGKIKFNVVKGIQKQDLWL